MVVISENSATRFIFLVQARTTSPFRMTEQAPQTPVPHPTLTPVRPMRRRHSASVSLSGSQVMNLSTPLILKQSLASLISPTFHPDTVLISFMALNYQISLTFF